MLCKYCLDSSLKIDLVLSSLLIYPGFDDVTQSRKVWESELVLTPLI